MSSNNGTRMDPRLADSIISVLRFICETKPLVAEDDRIVIDGGLVRICEKNEVIALGETVRSLAADIRVILGTWYLDDGACVRMSESIAEAEKNLGAVLDEVRTCLLSCNDEV